MKKNMKGIELPVNVLVIIAIAVLVMLGMIALYVAGIIPAGQINEIGAVADSCGQLKGEIPSCASDPDDVLINWDADKDGDIDDSDSLLDYCEAHKGCDNYFLDTDGDGEQGVDEDSGAETDASKACCKVIVCGCTGIEKPKRVP